MKKKLFILMLMLLTLAVISCKKQKPKISSRQEVDCELWNGKGYGFHEEIVVAATWVKKPAEWPERIRPRFPRLPVYKAFDMEESKTIAIGIIRMENWLPEKELNEVLVLYFKTRNPLAIMFRLDDSKKEFVCIKGRSKELYKLLMDKELSPVKKAVNLSEIIKKERETLNEQVRQLMAETAKLDIEIKFCDEKTISTTKAVAAFSDEQKDTIISFFNSRQPNSKKKKRRKICQTSWLGQGKNYTSFSIDHKKRTVNFELSTSKELYEFFEKSEDNQWFLDWKCEE